MTRQCKHEECKTRASFGVAGSPPEFCAQHCKAGMMDVRRKRCRAEQSCARVATYGYNTAEFCAQHASADMVNIRHKTCAQHNCTTRPSFAQPGKRAEFCSKHARVGMVNVCSKSCARQGCTVRPSFGQVGSTKAEFCLVHASDEMVDVVSRRCAHPDCYKQPSFGMEGKKVEYCSGHAVKGMVNVVTKRCAHPDCNKQPSFFVPGSRKVEFCLTHVKDRTLRSAEGHGHEDSDDLVAERRGEDELHLERTTRKPASGKDGRRAEPVEVSATAPQVRRSSPRASEFEFGHRAVVQQPPLPALRAVLPQGTSATKAPANRSSVPQRLHFLHTDGGDLAGKSLPAPHHPHGVLSGACEGTRAGSKGKRGWKPVLKPPESTAAEVDHQAVEPAARWRPVFEPQQRKSGRDRGGREGRGSGGSDDYRVGVPPGFELGAATIESAARDQESCGAVRNPRRGSYVPEAKGRSAWRPVFGVSESLDVAGEGHETGGDLGAGAVGSTGGQDGGGQCPYETFQEFKARRSGKGNNSSGGGSGGSGIVHEKIGERDAHWIHPNGRSSRRWSICENFAHSW